MYLSADSNLIYPHQPTNHVWYWVHQTEGGGSGLQRDPLQSEADHSDGKTQEILQWEGRSPSHQPQVNNFKLSNLTISSLSIFYIFVQVSFWRKKNQWWRDSKSFGDGTRWCHRGVPRTDRRSQCIRNKRIVSLKTGNNGIFLYYVNFQLVFF